MTVQSQFSQMPLPTIFNPHEWCPYTGPLLINVTSFEAGEVSGKVIAFPEEEGRSSDVAVSFLPSMSI